MLKGGILFHIIVLHYFGIYLFIKYMEILFIILILFPKEKKNHLLVLKTDGKAAIILYNLFFST
jgi:hypothetical protein